jgi:23S rRNA (cytidine1920-2'-O)/16S rRNA (cytidine1409-2'-O)-methyltransferase
MLLTTSPLHLPHLKKRVDILLVEKGLVSSRQRAGALIMAGKVTADGVKIDKPGKEVDTSAVLSVKEHLPYVSRGGLKLAPALDSFGINPGGLMLLDAGASTGGFTDCLLERGARKVIALDVGYGQLDWRLRNDVRVTVLERTNVRFLRKESLPHPVDAAVADLSFISLGLVLPPLKEILPENGWIVVLVKPQFEVGREHVGKGGVVRDFDKIRNAVESVKMSADNCGFLVLGEMESPLRGPKGNREFFLHLKRT